MLTIYSFTSVEIGSIWEVFYIENSHILKKTKNILRIYGKNNHRYKYNNKLM